MTRYLVDTSVWVNVLRGDIQTRERLRGIGSAGNSILMCEPIAMELLAGARRAELPFLREFIDSFASLDFDPLHDFRSAGEIRRELAGQGKTVRSIVDCMVAALALIHDEVVIVHNDSDFEVIAEFFSVMHERWDLAA